ncbi:MAG: hypothetical protein ABIH59_02480 [archaeon]
MKRGNKSGQVWVETVIYTLIALTIIGLFLSFAKPEIEKIQDKTIIDQSIEILEDINSIILDISQKGSGNQRIIELGIRKGSLIIKGEEDQLVFVLEGKSTFSEPVNDQEEKYINVGNLLAKTVKRGSINEVTLLSNYSQIYNITYQGVDREKIISKAPSSYTLSLSNKGELNGKDIIDIKII